MLRQRFKENLGISVGCLTPRSLEDLSPSLVFKIQLRWVSSKDDSKLCRFFGSAFLAVKGAYRELQFKFFMLDSE